MATLASNIWLQLITATIGTLGFGILFKLRGKNLFFSTLGAFITWGIYVLVFNNLEIENYNRAKFIAAISASLSVAIYAQIMARVNKAPATVFLATSAFPLIPGDNLYYMMYDIVIGDIAGFKNNAIILIITCLAMAFGFTIVEAFNKYIFIFSWGNRKK